MQQDGRVRMCVRGGWEGGEEVQEKEREWEE